MKHQVEGGETDNKPKETFKENKKNKPDKTKEEQAGGADETLGRRRRNR